MTEILLVIVIVLLIINIFINTRKEEVNMGKISENIENKFDNMQKSFREEFYTNREESRRNEQDNRQEIKVSIDSMTSSISRHIMNLSTLQQNQFDINSKNLENTLNSFNENMIKSLDNLSQLQNEKLSQLKETTEEKFTELTKSTEENLEKMRVTVDEKLQSTLEKRLGESFKMVNDRLEQVYKGLGEMQTLANGVGDLKKVLSNVKTRGVLGEIQLERILEQFLAQEQYDKNVITKKGSRETVEFAIKLPGKDELKETIYLPIDAKFPLDIYNKLVDAYEEGNQNNIDITSKELEKFIRKSAKDIRDKYIDPPNTTEFGILFLPTEGLYAEVIKRQQLVEDLQRNYKINITGPTTLIALLNSLQMGFKTLAIERHSSEVWKVLGAVKTEFSKFETVLNAAQTKLNQASSEIDKLVGTRTRQINRKLESVEKLSHNKAYDYISSSEDDKF
ncbi:MAG: DNA recombination protein RmuC [Clostridiales bacterium]|uniref:DNA recombination protein RmuC n=1 Tax=Terrisporobacter sp. TaxID=1965305 RepID=UPI002A4FDBF5|nr:DNA recombination protein RmuC [Terrisporobacter sp.]MCI5628532.1 DNA recombination protein RmuC [Clostridium sp.]MDD7753677.1 DNA recombination protein RmuC [Clostridiales bacterium]MCI7207662.1 DNA recombination protein RmuC [Clostridium sp.]MDY4136208.1 DNA recombination protein RmuC [Terrisporobacter sp.]MDY6153626.1 DNA recombination protein RmuC [Terrisporobacter sp.]